MSTSTSTKLSANLSVVLINIQQTVLPCTSKPLSFQRSRWKHVEIKILAKVLLTARNM